MFESEDEVNDLDEQMVSPIVRGDEERLMQILLCLQSNALKFTE